VPPKVSARDGGTVVQVTNNIQQPNIGALLEPGKNKSAGVALLLTLLLVGAGQIYNGQVGKGILFFIFTVGLWFIMLGWVIHIWAMIDAYSVAKDLNGKYQRRLAAGYA
jgi:TM2 domain-containing membrane protein YozV